MIETPPVKHFKCNGLHRFFKLELPNGISIRLHRWEEGDPVRYQHSHPWPFFLVCLKGGYDDIGFGRPTDPVRAPALRYRPSGYHHAVCAPRRNTITLVITGRKRRPWRFWIGGSEVDATTWSERDC